MIHSHSIIGRRETNEDSMVISLKTENNEKYNKFDLLGVFDGHGGGKISNELQKEILILKSKKIKSTFINKKSDTSKLKFQDYFTQINNNLRKKYPFYSKISGSTACVMLGYNDKNNNYNYWILNTGDSRAILCDKNNQAKALSIDHKPTLLSEKKRIQKLGGTLEFDGHEWRIEGLSLSRAFGDFSAYPYVTHIPDIKHYKYDNDKYIVIACDGLFDVLSNSEVIEFINKNIKKYKKINIAEKLALYAFEKGSYDNISIIIYFFE